MRPNLQEQWVMVDRLLDLICTDSDLLQFTLLSLADGELCSYSWPGMWALQECAGGNEVLKGLVGLKVPMEWLRCWQLCCFEREIRALHSRGTLKCLADPWLRVGTCFALDLWESGSSYWRAFDYLSCVCTYQLHGPAAPVQFKSRIQVVASSG